MTAERPTTERLREALGEAIAFAERLDEEAARHPLRLVEVSRPLFRDALMRPLARMAALLTAYDPNRDVPQALAAAPVDRDEALPFLAGEFVVHISHYKEAARMLAALSAPEPKDRTSYIEVRSTACRAGSDGDCSWDLCPQTRDGEPVATGRHCPLDREDSR